MRAWRAFLAFGLALSTVNAVLAEEQRLDPHGPAQAELRELSLTEHTECRVCHVVERTGKLGLKPGSASSCFACHGKQPHSGTEEHTVPGKVDCLSCHLPHRAGKGFHAKRRTGNPLLLRQACTECHKWR